MSSVVLVDTGIGKTKVNAFRYSRHIDVVSVDAFMNNMNLTAIELPDVDIFQDMTFSGCSALQELTLPAIDYTNVNLFGDDVPPTLNKLTFKQVEDKQLKLGNAFSRLSSLKQVNFDNALTEFDCNSLQSSKDIKFLDLGNICNVSENALSGMTSLEEVHVPV